MTLNRPPPSKVFRPQWDVPVPARMKKLVRDPRGYLVPRFVTFIKDGRIAEYGEKGAVADFRAIDTRFLAHAINNNRCWLCGDTLGAVHAFVIGPMCAVNRITSEPGSHRDCALYALKTCPFMIQPRMRRNETSLPEVTSAGVYTDPAGFHNPRNPGTMLLWPAGPAKPFKAGTGFLLKLSDPKRPVEWWTQARHASRDEAERALHEGVAELMKIASTEGGTGELARLANVARQWLPLQRTP